MDQPGTLYGVLRSRNDKQLPCYTMAEKCGGVFKLTPPPPGQTAWTEQTIWKFERGTDGFDPVHAPIIAKDGTLYGTTVEEYSDCGTVYKLTPPRGNRTHWKEEVIWRFPQSQSSGCGPNDAPIVDKTGAVYGTTIAVAAPNIYKLTPPVEGQSAWTETNLVALDSVGSLIADRNGTLYGGMLTGGSNNAGFVYSLTGTGFVPE